MLVYSLFVAWKKWVYWSSPLFWTSCVLQLKSLACFWFAFLTLSWVNILNKSFYRSIRFRTRTWLDCCSAFSVCLSVCLFLPDGISGKRHDVAMTYSSFSYWKAHPSPLSFSAFCSLIFDLYDLYSRKAVVVCACFMPLV